MDSALRHAFVSQQKKHGLLKEKLRLVKRKDLDRYEIASIPENLSFEKGFFLFIRACQLLTQNMEGVIIVGLAGPSGAGKTVFTEKVSNFMPGITCISMDNYNDASRLIDGNYDDPRLTDYDLLLSNIQDLKAGKAVEIPIYDFKQSCRTGFRKLGVPSSRIVIVEGIYALSEKLQPLLDLRVSVTGGVHFDLVKRVLRDINRSGQAPEDIIHQVSETVYPMYKAFIEPDLEAAHLKIVNKFNPFSGLQSPTYILKSNRIVNDTQIREVFSPDHTESVEETYDIYLLPPGEDPDVCQSYLRMRNRDGKYTLMFEECLIDNPFIISPRITFEVSVRLLGGLMALGYTIAAILKRTSRVFIDDRLCVKIDKLEQLHRKFIQIQGKDRILVAETAKRLGLDGTYITHSYIEQIQLEKLTAELTTLPEDLKSKIKVSDDSISNSLPSFSWISEVKPGVKNLYSKSLAIDQTNGKSGKLQRLWLETNNKSYDDKGPDSPLTFQSDQGCGRFSEQLAGVNDRLDELLQRLGGVDTKFGNQTAQKNPAFGVGSLGNAGSSVYMNGHLNGGSMLHNHSPALASSSATAVQDSAIVEEVKMLARGQKHLTTQLDALSNLLRESISSRKQTKHNKTGFLEGLLVDMRSSDSGLAVAVGLTVLGSAGVACVALHASRRS